MVTRIKQISVVSDNPGRLAEFYKNIPGFHFLFETNGLYFVEIGGIRLMISKPENGSQTSNSVLYYESEDLDATFAEFEKKGIPIEQKPHVVGTHANTEYWIGFIRDPDKNIVGFTKERAI